MPDTAGRVRAGRDEHIEIQYGMDSSAFRATLFASPVDDGKNALTSHFLSYLDITRWWVAEEGLHTLTVDLEARIAARPDCNKGT